MNQRMQLTVSAAVDAFEVERRTLQRLLGAGQLDGATKNERGHWLIPIEALHAAGFDARQTWLNDATKSATRRDSVATNTRQPLENTGHDNATAVATERDSVATEVAELRVMLEAARQEIKAKDLLLESVERNADDLRSSLRMLEAGASAGERPAPSRRWWQRRV